MQLACTSGHPRRSVWGRTEAACTHSRHGRQNELRDVPRRCGGGRRPCTFFRCPPRLPPQIWNDYKLKWNPSDYDGAEFMRVPAQKIWKPDIVLYNK